MEHKAKGPPDNDQQEERGGEWGDIPAEAFSIIPGGQGEAISLHDFGQLIMRKRAEEEEQAMTIEPDDRT